jgi:hypothetical protein
MTYLSTATYQILLAIFIFYCIFFLVDMVHYFFVAWADKFKDDNDTNNINIFVGNSMTPTEKFKYKK